jgi:hypothetical protein
VNTIEDRLRAAAEAAAGTVADGSAPPLRLPERRALRGRVLRGRARRRGWPGWAPPLAAAAAVLAVVAGSLALGGALSSGGSPAPGRHRTGPAAPAARPSSVDGLPPYFLALSIGTSAGSRTDRGRTAGSRADLGRGGRSPGLPNVDVNVIDTATGKVAATVTFPGGKPSALTLIAADDKGAFFAALPDGPAVPGGASATRFYEIRLRPGSAHATVTRLPIPAVANVGSFAVSPDGSKLAITTYTWHGNAGLVQTLIVASAATGAERTWTTPVQDSGGSMGEPVIWLANGRTVAVNWLGSAAVPSSVRLIDTAAPGSDLLAGPEVLPLNRNQFSDLVISPDGRILTGDADHPKSPAVVDGKPVVLGSQIVFSARTGAARLLYQPPTVTNKATGQVQTSDCNDPVWMSNSGREELLMCGEPRPYGNHAVLLDHGKVIQLRWLARFASDELAF